jgi:hypothetical protein
MNTKIIAILGLIVFTLLLYSLLIRTNFEEQAPYDNPTTTNANINTSDLAFPEYDYGGWWWSSYPLYDYNYYPYIWGDRYYHGDTHWDRPRGGHPRPRPPPPPPGGSPMGGSMPRGGGASPRR